MAESILYFQQDTITTLTRYNTVELIYERKVPKSRRTKRRRLVGKRIPSQIGKTLRRGSQCIAIKVVLRLLITQYFMFIFLLNNPIVVRMQWPHH